MKIGILGDTHFGVRNDSKLFHDYFELYIKNELIPSLKKNKVTDLFQVGDLFDNRKWLSLYMINRSKEYFFDALRDNGITLHTLIGNHDIYWRDSLAINSPMLVLNEYENVHIYNTPTTVKIEDTTIDIIPWICTENKDAILNFIRNSKSDLCFGHFEIASFAMYRGMSADHGLDMKMFEKYEKVLSGHYHTKSTKGNITYVGTPWEMTWQDFNDPRGYHTFDLKSRKLQFYKNPYVKYVRIEYDDKGKEPVDLKDMNIEGCFIRLVVVNKTDYYKYDLFLQRLQNKGVYDLKIVEDVSEFTKGELSEEINLEDTIDVMSKYIDTVDTDIDKESVKNFMKTLYIEAMNLNDSL